MNSPYCVVEQRTLAVKHEAQTHAEAKAAQGRFYQSTMVLSWEAFHACMRRRAEKEKPPPVQVRQAA